VLADIGCMGILEEIKSDSGLTRSVEFLALVIGQVPVVLALHASVFERLHA
jgi:hypothetical protein